MAGLPLKSGADFYNLEAARMRLHNLGADPTEVGAGLIYFNTSTGLNTSQKARLYTGSAWKTIAFSEDLDVASNADFLALKEKVDTLIGDGVDMDGIIESWKEVEAFLSGMSDTKSLMDLLSGKLNTSGGTITGNIGALKIKRSNGNSSAIHFQNIVDNKDNDLGGLGFGNDGKPYVFSPDYSTKNEILTSAGGTIISNSYGGGLILKRNASNTGVALWFANNSGSLGGLVCNENKELLYDNGATAHTLLHSGNVGEYACKAININSDITDTDKAYVGRALSAWTNWGKTTNNPNGVAYASGLTISFAGNAFQIAKDAYDLGKLYVRMSNYQSDSIPSWSDWKTIAFTDSNVASATKLQTARTIWGQSFDGTGDVSGALYLGTGTIRSSKSGTDRVFLDFGNAGDPYIGYGTASAGIDSHLCGNNIYLHYGTSRTNGLILNSSGNVTIGASDLASTCKLAVTGDVALLNPSSTLNASSSKLLFHSAHDNISGPSIQGVHAGMGYGAKHLVFNQHDTNGYIEYEAMRLTYDGKLLIGTTTDNGAKLQVNGSVSIADNILFGSSGKLDKYGNFHFTKDAGTWSLVRYNGEDAVCIYNSTGNVLIGTTTDTGEKLQVAGRIASKTQNGANKVQLITDADLGICMTSNHSWMHIAGSGSSMFIYNGEWDSTGTGNYNKGITITTANNIGIGTATPQSKFDVNGDVHVSGNLIVDGEVSAGGAAEEGGNAGGGGAFHSDIIKEGAMQTTIAHGLGTDDIVVSIYEKDGVSGRWSIILTDVEIVDANNIIVSFGSVTSVEHKVVIMGAVA